MTHKLLALLAAATLVGCSNDDVAETVHVKFTASPEEEISSRAGFNPKDPQEIVWNSGDKLAVFTQTGRTTPYEFTLTEGAGTNDGTFEGDIASDYNEVIGLYPYSDKLNYNPSDNTITQSFLADQTATPGTYDPRTGIMFAKTNKQVADFDFTNTVGYVQVELPMATKSITLQPLVGDDGSVGGVLSSPEVLLNTSTGALSPADGNPSRRDVTLHPAEGQSTIPAGTYYLAVLPTTLKNGFWLSYVDESDKMHLRSYQKEYEMKPNTVTQIGEMTNENSAVLLDDPNQAKDIINQNIGSLTSLSFISNQHKPEGVAQDYWYTLNNNNLTFFTSKERYVINGDIYAMFWLAGNLKTVNMGDTSFPDMSTITFFGASKLENVTFGDNFDWSHITSFGMLFWTCTNLKSVDFGKGVGKANITDAQSMFRGCSSLVDFDLSSINFSNVTNVSLMFYTCASLKSVDLSKVDFSNVTNMESMFYECNNLQNVYFGSSFNLGSVETMSSMFASCHGIEAIDLSSLVVSGKQNMERMFGGCSNLKTVTFGNNFNTSNCTNMKALFSGCKSLTDLDVNNLDTKNVTNMGFMFDGCQSLVKLDLSNLDTDHVENMQMTFYNCPSLTDLYLGPNFYIRNSMFTGNIFGEHGNNKINVWNAPLTTQRKLEALYGTDFFIFK